MYRLQSERVSKLIIALAGMSLFALRTRLLESSQEQYRNAPIRRPLPIGAWLRLALCPVPSLQWAQGQRQAALSARRGSRQASASSALEYYFDPGLAGASEAHIFSSFKESI